MTLVSDSEIDHRGEKCRPKENRKMETKIITSQRVGESSRKSYSVIMREALERFKGRKRSRKYVLSDQPKAIIDQREINNDHYETSDDHFAVNKYIDFAQSRGFGATPKACEENDYHNDTTTKSSEQIDCDANHVTRHPAKHRNQIKKYFSSPNHKRRENIQHANNQQTYVSYKDDFSPEYLMSEQSYRHGEVTIKNELNDHNSISPNSDDVFDDVTTSHITNQKPIVHQTQTNDYMLRPHYMVHHPPNFNGCDIMETKCSVPNCNNMVKVLRPSGVEQLMTAADLHASLDNALNILDESTKLLHRNTSSYTSPYFTTNRLHNNPSHGGHHYFFPATRPRAYSTGSKLETIEEENDKSDDILDSTIAHGHIKDDGRSSREYVQNMACDAVSSRLESSSQFGYGTMTTSDCCDSIVSSEASIFLSSVKHKQESSTANYGSLVRPRDRSMYGTTERSHSTSTISIKNLPSPDNPEGDILLQTFGSNRPGDVCSACDWVRRHMPFASANAPVPPNEWQNIMQMVSRNACGHYHAWGLCENKNCEPSLCHSHYLQFYQYLQKHGDRNRRRRVANSCSSQADSVIDYDINEVLSSLDEVISYSDVSLSRHPNYSRRKLNAHHKNVDKSNLALDSSDDSGHIQRGLEKCPLSDSASINSDSAFSTNGSPTPSTRDGVNTDGESLDSLPILNSDDFSSKCRQLELPRTGSIKQNEITSQRHIHEWRKTLSTGEKLNRYSLESSEGSSPGNYDCRDSAVYLHDSSSSHTTNLSSESFSSSSTFNRIRLHKNEPSQYRKSALSSSSEESLVSEGTLCLSDMEALKNNRTSSNDSLFSPFRMGYQETVLLGLGASSLHKVNKSYAKAGVTNTDTLTSSSSDSNTLSSGSSGQSYLTFRSSVSTSVYNTLDSSSCVSTDDTGDTIIYQGKRISSSPKQKYQQSAFHYQNLTIPVEEEKVAHKTQDNLRLRTISESSGYKQNFYTKPQLLPQTYRSLSLSCIVTSSKLCYYGNKANSTPDLYSSLTNIHLHTAKVDYNENIVEKRIIFSEQTNLEQKGNKQKQFLSEKVDLMLQNCNRVSSMLESLKAMMENNLIEKSDAENKIIKMEKALTEKDAIIKELYTAITNNIPLKESST